MRKGRRSSATPHEKGQNLAYNTGPKPPAPVTIADYSAQSPRAGQGQGSTAGVGTPSPAVGMTTGMGKPGEGAPGKMGGGKVVGPKHGKGPTGIGRTGTGAPWG